MAFNYTSGNPDNLTGGSPARMQDVQGPFYDIRAYLNSPAGGGGGTGSSVAVLATAPVLDVGVQGQVRAGRQLTAADFTGLGLSQPVGLFNLSDLTNLGSAATALSNKGSVPFAAGINGFASTAAQFIGSTGQALYIADSGASDPYRIRTGSWGCWFRTAKRGTFGMLVDKYGLANQQAWSLYVNSSNNVQAGGSSNGAANDVNAVGASDVADDRWHFAVCTADGTTWRVYVDGVLEAAVSAGVVFAGASPLNIGARSADASTAAQFPHFGRVDEAFVTADVLSEDEIRCLYAAKLTHTLGVTPTAARLSVHRRRKGATLAVADFTTTPLRLHNFTAGALTDEGSNGQALTNAYTTLILPVAGADGAPNGGFSYGGAHQGLTATDAGLPSLLAARSYGCWFKTSTVATAAWLSYGATASRDVIYMSASGLLTSGSGADFPSGPFVADGQWHFVVVSADNAAGDGVRRKVYLDGRLVIGSTVLGSLTPGGANRFRIGADTDGTLPFTGQVDGAFVCGYSMSQDEVLRLYAKSSQDLGASPKNPGDHVERVDASSVLFIGDTLESQHTIDLAVVA